MRIHLHYRPHQHLVLFALSLVWLVLLPLAFASALVTAGTNLADQAITTAQHRVLNHPVCYSRPAQQRVWRVRS